MRVNAVEASTSGMDSVCPSSVVAVDDRHVAQDPRREAPAAVGQRIGAQRHLVLRAAVDVAEHAARQPAPRQQAQVGDVHRPRAQPFAAGASAAAEAHDRAQGLQHAVAMVRRYAERRNSARRGVSSVRVSRNEPAGPLGWPM